MGEEPNPLDAVESFSSVFSTMVDVTRSVLAFPSERRQLYRDVIDETHSLLDNAIGLVITRLSSMLEISDEYKDLINKPDPRYLEQREVLHSKFIRELRRLDNFTDWENMVRSVSLCRPLKKASGEMESLYGTLRDQIAVKNSGKLKELIYDVLRGEKSLASFITQSLQDLAKLSSVAGTSHDEFLKTEEKVRQLRDALKLQRKNLIASEVDFDRAINPSKKGEDVPTKKTKGFWDRFS